MKIPTHGASLVLNRFRWFVIFPPLHPWDCTTTKVFGKHHCNLGAALLLQSVALWWSMVVVGGDRLLNMEP